MQPAPPPQPRDGAARPGAQGLYAEPRTHVARLREAYQHKEEEIEAAFPQRPATAALPLDAGRTRDPPPGSRSRDPLQRDFERLSAFKKPPPPSGAQAPLEPPQKAVTVAPAPIDLEVPFTSWDMRTMLDQEVCRTTRLYARLLSRTKLTMPLLRRPPTALIRDVFVEVLEKTGFGEGEFIQQELDGITHTEVQMLGFLHKLAKLVSRHDPPGSATMPSAEELSVSPLRKNILLQKLHEEALRQGVRVSCPDGRTRRVDLTECPTADLAVLRLREEVFPGVQPLLRLQQQDGRLLPPSVDLRAFRSGPPLVALRRGGLLLRVETRCCCEPVPDVALHMDGELFQVADATGATPTDAPEGHRHLRSQTAGMPAKEQEVVVRSGEDVPAQVQVEVWLFAYSDVPEMDSERRPMPRQVWLCADAGQIPDRAMPFRCAFVVPRGDGTEMSVKLPGGIDHHPARVPVEEIVSVAEAATGGPAVRRCPLLDAYINPAPNKDYVFRAKDRSPLVERTENLGGGCEFQRLLKGRPVVMGHLRPSVTVVCNGTPHRVDILDHPTAGQAAERLAKDLGTDPKLIRLQHIGRVLGLHEQLVNYHEGRHLDMVLLGKIVVRPRTGCCGDLAQGACMELDGESVNVDPSGEATVVTFAGNHLVRSRFAGMPALDHTANVTPGADLELSFPVDAWLWVYSRLPVQAVEAQDDPACIEREVVLCADYARVPPTALPVLGYLRASCRDGEELALELSSGTESREVRAVRLPLERLVPRKRAEPADASAEGCGSGEAATDDPCPLSSVCVDVVTHVDYNWHPLEQSPWAQATEGECVCHLRRLLQGESLVVGHLKPVIHVEGPDGKQLARMHLAEHPTAAHALSTLAQQLNKEEHTFCLQYRGQTLDHELPLHSVHGGPALRAVMFGEVMASACTKCCGHPLPGVDFELQGQQRLPADDSGTALLRAPAGKHTVRSWRKDSPLDLRTVAFNSEERNSQKFLVDVWLWVYAEEEFPSEAPKSQEQKSKERQKAFTAKKGRMATALLQASKDGSLEKHVKDAEALDEQKSASPVAMPPTPTEDTRPTTAETTRPPTAATDFTRPTTAELTRPATAAELAADGTPAADTSPAADAAQQPLAAPQRPPAEPVAKAPAAAPPRQEAADASEAEVRRPKPRRVWISASRGKIPENMQPLGGLLYAPCEGGGEMPVELAAKGANHGATLLPLDRLNAQAVKLRGTDKLEQVPERCSLHGLRLEPVAMRGYAWTPQERSPLAERCEREGGCEFRRLLEGEPVLMGHLRPIVQVHCGKAFDGRVILIDLELYPTVAAAGKYISQELNSALPVGLSQDGRLLPSTMELYKCHGGYSLTAVVLGCIAAKATTACCGVPVAGVEMELGECNAVGDEDGKATLVATSGFQVLRARRKGGHFHQQPVTVVAGGHEAATVPVAPALYVFAEAAALDANGEALPRQISVTADIGRIPEGAEPVRGLLFALAKDGCEITEELAGGTIPQAVHLPLQSMARGECCPLESIRVEPANNLDYAWHPRKPSPLEQRIQTDGGCELSRLLHGEPLVIGSLRPTVRVQCQSGRVLKVDIEEFPTIKAAAQYVALVSGTADATVHLQQNGRILERERRLGSCHGGPMVSAVPMPEGSGGPR